MNTAKIKLIFAGVKGAMVKHSPEILTGMGVVGMITAGILAVRATPKALILIEEKKKEADVERLSAVETVKTAGKMLYSCGVNSGCFCCLYRWSERYKSGSQCRFGNSIRTVRVKPEGLSGKGN